jgi:MFS family permease
MVTYGYLQTVFAAMQLLGGPVYGRLGDMFGSRAVLVLAHACGFSTYFMIAIANSSAMLFLSRIPGMLMHGAQGNLSPTCWSWTLMVGWYLVEECGGPRTIPSQSYLCFLFINQVLRWLWQIWQTTKVDIVVAKYTSLLQPKFPSSLYFNSLFEIFLQSVQ